MHSGNGPRRGFFRRLADAVASVFADSPRAPRPPDRTRAPDRRRRVAERPSIFPSAAGTDTERSLARRNLYQWLTRVPHRDYGPAVADFREALGDDPDFIARACVWVNGPESGQQIRDIQDVACITLLQAPASFPDYREAGRCTLLGNDVYPQCGMPGLPPYRIFRLAKFVSQSAVPVPRLMRSTINDYFKALESDPARLDGVALRNRSAMKRTWRSHHLSAARFPRCHAILFGTPPENSRIADLRRIAAMRDPTEQAKAIVAGRIPYVVATSLISQWTPAAGIALIEAMSATEAVNSRAWIERSGLLQHHEVRTLYLDKVSLARGSVAAMTHRESARGRDEQVQEAISTARERAVAGSRRIGGDLLLLIDKSASMSGAIAAARQLGSRIGPLCDGRIMAVAFDSNAREVRVEDPVRLASWEAAFRGILPGGQTSIGIGLEYALRHGFLPGRVVVVTDSAENTRPFLADVANQIPEPPGFVFIVVPGDRGQVLWQLEQQGHRLETFQIHDLDDYSVYDQVTAVLGGPPGRSLVDQILETELPRRST